MRFQLLGPVTAFNDRDPVPLGSTRQRTVLAVLLTEPTTMISTDQLVERVWGVAAPQRARQTLHTYLSRLRSVLTAGGGPTLARSALGYGLDLDPATIDLHQFRTLVTKARQLDDNQATAIWQQAMGLWQGRPLASVDSDWLEQVATGLEAERLAAALEYTDVRLRRGDHARLLPELTAAVREHPLDERLAGQLMLALYRCGRQADALACYRQVHDRLVEELGSNPAPELRELHQRILRQDLTLATTGSTPATTAVATTGSTPASTAVATNPAADNPAAEPTGSTRCRPAQLPADVAGFAGRANDLRRLDELLGETTNDQAQHAVVITAIGGTAGVGKTALAIHWAHRAAHQFPDGQLYVNLRGYDPDQPVTPGDALTRFLTALGVTGNHVPVELDDRAARYRSEIAGKRLLIVLDNAASVAQVRPLLPGSGSCRLLVTSRDSLPGLVAVHGAYRLDLDLLPPAEAVGLLRRLIGPRVGAEPEAAATLAQQCARLPLALRVAAELAAARPDEPLAGLVAELADQQQRLDLLDTGGDPHAAVQTVFSWSIQHLAPATAATFRRLGLHPGPDLDPYAVAALANTEVATARRELAELARAHLVHRTGPGRYGMHDLLRAYATQLATETDSEPQRQAAETRLLDYYQATVTAAMDTLHPAEAHYRPPPPAAATPAPDLTVPAAARTWLATERLCLMAVAGHAAARSRSDYVVGLTRLLHRYLGDGHLTDMVTINELALRAARQAGDVLGEAHAQRHLGVAHNRLSRYELAMEQYEQALARFQRVGDLVGEALTMTSIGVTNYRMGNHKQSIEDHMRSIALAQQAGDQLGEAFALNNVANVKERLGRYDEAADHHHRALALFDQLGSRYCAALGRSNLANVELRRGEFELAAEHQHESLMIAREFGTPMTEAHGLDTLGILHLRLGEPELAAGHFQQAYEIYHRHGERGAQAWSLNGLGEAAQLAGRHDQAHGYHTKALTIATDTSTRHQEARAHVGLGHAHRCQGDLVQARSHYEQANAIYSELDMPDAEDVLGYLTILSRG